MTCNNSLWGGYVNPFVNPSVAQSTPMNDGWNAPADRTCPHSQYKFVCQCSDYYYLTNNENFNCSNPLSSYDRTGWGDCQIEGGHYNINAGITDPYINGCNNGNRTCPSTYYQGIAGSGDDGYNSCGMGCTPKGSGGVITGASSNVGGTNAGINILKSSPVPLGCCDESATNFNIDSATDENCCSNCCTYPQGLITGKDKINKGLDKIKPHIPLLVIGVFLFLLTFKKIK